MQPNTEIDTRQIDNSTERNTYQCADKQIKDRETTEQTYMQLYR